MKKVVYTFLFIITLSTSMPILASEVEIDTIYYDKDWKGVSNHNFADFYRIIEKDPLPNYPKRFRDFYITGEKQGEGFYEKIDSSDDSKTILGSGDFYWYYKNGEVSKKMSFENGIPNGECIEYYENNKLKSKATYKNGSLDGEYSIYLPDGKIMERGVYKENNYLGGEAYSYYDNGQISKLMTIKEGQMNSDVIEYYENGHINKQYSLRGGKLNGEYVEYTQDGLRFEDEYFRGNPTKDYIIVSNTDGLYSKVNRKDKSLIYSSPSLNDKQTETIDDKIWNYYINDGMIVSLRCEYKNDYGKYIRVYLIIMNNTFYPMEFDPGKTMALLTDKKGKDSFLEIQTAQEYSKRIGRTQMWEEGLAAFGESMNAQKKSYSKSTTATIRNNGSASISSTKTYDANAALTAEQIANQRIAELRENNFNKRESKIENYVRKVTIEPGQTYEGYFNIKRKKGESIEIKVNIGGATYIFPYSL